jgi:hypothetical protein
MKDIPTEELATISTEIHEAAERVGCTFVSVSSPIWPGGKISGPSEEAARFVEFSWLRAAVINGRAIFEEGDPRGYNTLLATYGLGDEPYLEPTSAAPASEAAEPVAAALSPMKTVLNAEVLAETEQELIRQARAAGMSVGEFLDWKFRKPQEH